MLIQSKKLPKNVEEERKNLYASKEGKALLAGAAELQQQIQGVADKAMAEAKRKKGTTGMNHNELENVLDDFGQHTHTPSVAAASKTSHAVSRYVFRDGKFVPVHRPPPLKR